MSSDKWQPSTASKDIADYGIYLKTAGGQAYRIARKAYDEAREVAGAGEGMRIAAGLFFPIVVIGFTVFFQFKYCGGLKPSKEAIDAYAVSTGALNASWWPLVTNVFLHFSTKHIVANMFAVSIFGAMVARGLGFFKTLLLYLASGVVAGAFGFVVSSASGATHLGGASGAVYALVIGGIIVSPTERGKWLSWELLLGLASLIAIPAIHSSAFVGQGVSHMAHLSGAVVGILLLLTLVEHEYRDAYRTSSVFLLLLLVAIGIFANKVFALWSMSKVGALDQAWPAEAKKAVWWLVGSGIAFISFVSHIVKRAHDVDERREADEHRKEVAELVAESGVLEEREIDAILEDLKQRTRLVHRSGWVYSPYGDAAEAFYVEPMLVACPLCDHDSTVPEIGDLLCPKCDWPYTVDDTGKVVGGIPPETKCPACGEGFSFRNAGEVKCPECTWTFKVDGAGGVVSGKPQVAACSKCELEFKVPGDGKYSCQRCGADVIVGIGQAPEGTGTRPTTQTGPLDSGNSDEEGPETDGHRPPGQGE